MWHRGIPVSSLAAYAADPEASCRTQASGRGRRRVLALGLGGLVVLAAALAATGRLPSTALPLDDLPAALLSLVHRS